MGMTTPVIHAAFASTDGPRLYDAPPDFGPDGPRWEGMKEIHRQIGEYQQVILGARQEAPVAILWPIRSFMAQNRKWQAETGGMREDLALLLLRCLEHQVGVHLLDEADLDEAVVRDGELTVGHAAYSHVLIPHCLVLHVRSIEALRGAAGSGVKVVGTGPGPQWLETDAGLKPAGAGLWDTAPAAEAVAALPRLVDVSYGVDIRCTAWLRGGVRTRLLMNIASEDRDAQMDGRPMRLAAGRVCVLPSA